MKYYRYLEIRYYLSNIEKGAIFGSLLVLVLVSVILYATIKYPMTGKITKHEVEIIGATITHGYSTMGQSLMVKLDGGEIINISHTGNLLKEGQLITIIEYHRKHGGKSSYVIQQ